MSTVAGLDVQSADQLAKTSGKALRKQLGFLDLVFACVLMVVIPDFFGTAVKAGSASVFFWLLALAFFFVPQAFIVSHLNQKLPLEGGLYEWARAAFGDVVGFLVAWNLWLYVVLYSAAVGLVTMNYLSYVLGPNHSWIATNRRALFGATIAIVAGLMLVTHFGLQIGKWITNAGSFVTIVTIAVLALLPFVRHAQGNLAEYHPLARTSADVPVQLQRLQQNDLRRVMRSGIRHDLFRRVAQPVAAFSARRSLRCSHHRHTLHFWDQRHPRLRPA